VLIRRLVDSVVHLQVSSNCIWSTGEIMVSIAKRSKYFCGILFLIMNLSVLFLSD
jgi:hypothetical protein